MFLTCQSFWSHVSASHQIASPAFFSPYCIILLCFFSTACPFTFGWLCLKTWPRHFPYCIMCLMLPLSVGNENAFKRSPNILVNKIGQKPPYLCHALEYVWRGTLKDFLFFRALHIIHLKWFNFKSRKLWSPHRLWMVYSLLLFWQIV